MRQVLMCCVPLVWYLLPHLAMTICGDAKRNVSLPSRGRDSRVLHSGFSRVRIYHNFCGDTELIHITHFRLGYPLSRDLNTRMANRSSRISLHIFQNKQRIWIYILAISSVLMNVMFNYYLTLKCMFKSLV